VKPVIRSLKVKGFRSFGSEQISFDNPTFLVGQNGAGKSKLVDTLAFLADAMSSPLSTAIARRGGVAALAHKAPGDVSLPTLGLAVDFGRINKKVATGHYAFEVRFLSAHDFEVVEEQCIVGTGKDSFYFERRGHGGDCVTNIPGLCPLLDSRSLGLLSISGHPQFSPLVRTLSSIRVYSIRPEKLREAQPADAGLGLWRDGGNVASVLREIERRSPADLERIEELLSVTLPHKILIRPIQQGSKLALEFTQEWDNKSLTLDAASMSDGTLRVLGLVAAVFQHPAPSLLVFEEPEATLHPGNLSVVLDLIHIACDRSQVLVTTHSPELLDAGKWIKDRHLRVVYWEDGATHVSRIGKASREALDEHLMGAGELLRSNVLDNPPVFRESSQVSLFEALP
jgi:predicted ATPase